MDCSKSYFIAVNIGYLIAIVCTIIVMLVFDHGQPALLYLVPGTILAVCTTALYKGEFNKMWEYCEDDYITPPDTEEDKKVDDSDNKKDKWELNYGFWK